MPDYRAAARRAAARHGLNPTLFERQIGAESGFNPNAGSKAGARGIAQFMPGTAAGAGVNLNDDKVSDDLDGAARLMAGYVKRYGSYEKALVAYNAGPGRVGKPLYAETSAYIKRIMGGSAEPGGSSSSSAPSSTETTTPGVDNSAVRGQLISQFLQRRNQDPLQFAMAIHGAQDTPDTTSTSTSAATSSGHASSIDAHEVAGWLAPAVSWARAHGWKGQVTSGIRSTALQKQLYARYQAGGNIAAKPGQSNHEAQNGGAIDVSDPNGFAAALRGYKGRKPIQGTAIGDPVHFSSTGR